MRTQLIRLVVIALGLILSAAPAHAQTTRGDPPPAGACCFGDTCVLVTPALCVNDGGVFVGGACTATTCQGACCDGFNCSIVSPTACDAPGAVFLGPGTNCLPNPCFSLPEGACCFPDGTCQDETTAPVCAQLVGTYQGDGTSCATSICPVLGACCLPDGSCTQTLSLNCLSMGGIFAGTGVDCITAACEPLGACCFNDGSCDLLEEVPCTILLGTYFGDGSNCAQIICVPRGACCTGTDCVVDTLIGCNFAGGTYLGNGSNCIGNPCITPTGACCLNDGSCEQRTSEQCDPETGFYEGDGTDCANVFCFPRGACCLNEECTITTDFACSFAGGTFLGEGTSCLLGTCETGACCFEDGTCQDDAIGLLCFRENGDFQGAGTDCATTLCPMIGACCLPAGDCSRMEPIDCAIANGTYRGDGSFCPIGSEPPCIPTGACCFVDGECEQRTEDSCLEDGVSYDGDGTTCQVPTTCEQAGACCFPGGLCAVIVGSGCAELGGTYAGDHTTCLEDSVCPLVAACCFSDLSCQMLRIDQCNDAPLAGTWHLGIDCANALCPSPGKGACCAFDLCAAQTPLDCASLRGDFKGIGTPCTPDTCTPDNAGACCVLGQCVFTDEAGCLELSGAFIGGPCSPVACDAMFGACCVSGQCRMLTLEECQLADGEFEGTSTSCHATRCDLPCPCDIIMDSLVDVTDLLQFLSFWFDESGGGPGTSADFNNDGTTDVTDLLAFLSCWFPAIEGAPCAGTSPFFNTVTHLALSFDPNDTAGTSAQSLTLISTESMTTAPALPIFQTGVDLPFQLLGGRLEGTLPEPFGPVLMTLRNDMPQAGTATNVVAGPGGAFVSGSLSVDLYPRFELPDYQGGTVFVTQSAIRLERALATNPNCFGEMLTSPTGAPVVLERISDQLPAGLIYNGEATATGSGAMPD